MKKVKKNIYYNKFTLPRITFCSRDPMFVISGVMEPRAS